MASSLTNLDRYVPLRLQTDRSRTSLLTGFLLGDETRDAMGRDLPARWRRAPGQRSTGMNDR